MAGACDQLGVTGLRPSLLPNRRMCGLPHPVVEPNECVRRRHVGCAPRTSSDFREAPLRRAPVRRNHGQIPPSAMAVVASGSLWDMPGRCGIAAEPIPMADHPIGHPPQAAANRSGNATASDCSSDVGARKVVASEEQRLIIDLRQRITGTISEVQASGMLTLSILQEAFEGDIGLSVIHRDDFCVQGDQQPCQFSQPMVAVRDHAGSQQGSVACLGAGVWNLADGMR